MTESDQITIYHNPRCSKSRAALALIEASGVTPRIVEYLSNPPSAQELAQIVKFLGVQPEALVRKNEDLYKRQFAKQRLSGSEWLDALARNPVLIERPIVVRGDRAVIGRPRKMCRRFSSDVAKARARYDEQEMRIDIASLKVLSGGLQPRSRQHVIDWVKLRRFELLNAWTLARQRKPLPRIEPLE